MNFNLAISEMMKSLENEPNESVMLYRENGEWRCNTVQNQYGEIFDWVEEAKKQDPFAITLTGKDLNGGSFAFVYDDIFKQRLRAEYDYMAHSGQITGATYKEPYVLIDFIEENVGGLSSEVTSKSEICKKTIVIG